MFILVTVLIMLVAIILGLIVLVQNGKGGGLAANFASQNQVMGVRKTTDFLEKATWFMATLLIVLCLTSSALVPGKQQQRQNTLTLPQNSANNTNNAQHPINNTATPQK